jgi:YgiT-type zinc finger domain-containing protein
MKQNIKALPEIPEVCPRCYFGRIQPGKRSFAARTAGKPLIVPDFPAWICDVCGFTIYDPASLMNLQRMLTNPPTPYSQYAGPKPTESKPAKSQPKTDQLA